MAWSWARVASMAYGVGPHRQRHNTTQTQDYDKTRPWIAEHCPHLLKGEDEAGDVGKKGKRGGGVIKKKTISADKQKVVISKEVRNKKKAVTLSLIHI